MPNKRTRERQLRKLAERRAAERRKKRRQKILALTVGLLVTAGLVGTVVFALMRDDEGRPSASGGPTPAPTLSPTTPATPAREVACGGSVPQAASVAKPTFNEPPPMTIDPDKTYTAIVETSCGTMRMNLFAKQAPTTVNSFVSLARQGFFDGLIFHRVIKGFVIQGGDPEGTGSGGPGYQFKDELDNDLKYEVGSVAMANSGPNTNGSQWFVVVGPQGVHLPKNYTIFGKVTQGIEAAHMIENLETDETDRPVQTAYIVKVTIEES